MEEETQYICITRPRRFGKTIMANMLGAFLGKRWNSSLIFDHLKIAESEKYQKYLNQYDLIYIDFSRLPENCTSYQQYISQIITGLKNDLIDAYPDYKLKSETAVWDKLEGSDRASSKGYIVRWVEAPSNKLLTTAFEASLESVTVTRRLSVDSKIAGIAMEHRNPKVSEGRHRGLGGRQYMHLSLW